MSSCRFSPLLLLSLACPGFAATPADRGEQFRALHQEASPEAGSAGEAWRSFRNGLRNQGVSAFAVRPLLAAGTGRAPRAQATGGLIWGTPVIDEAGRVYVGSADKVFYCYQPEGSVKWTYTLPDAGDSLIDSAAVLAPGNRVVVPGGDGSLHCLNRETGALQWRFKAYHADDHESGVVVNSFEGNVVLGPDDLLYAGSDNGHMYCVDLDGKERWNFGTKMMIWTAAAFHTNGWMAFGSLDKGLYVLERATGKQIAKYSGGGEFKSSPAIDEAGRIYVGNSDFVFRCLELSKSIFGYPVLTQKWSFPTGGDIYSSPAIYQNKVIFGSHDGFLYCLDTNGKLIWKYGCHARISGSPLVSADGVVFVGAKNGKLYAIDSETGKRIWSFKPTQGLRKVNLDSSPALSPDGTIYLGSYDSNIYAVPVDYPTKNPQDPRVDVSPEDDVPDFGSALPPGGTLRFVDRAGQFSENLAEPIGVHSPVTLRLVSTENGHFVPNAGLAVTGLKVTIEPKIPIEVVVSSDSYQLNILPERPLDPGTRYRVKVSGRYYHRKNPFVDLLKWWNLPKVEFTGEFSTKPMNETEATFTPGEDLRYTVEGMYATQPEILDTLIPAALDGQAFIVSVPFVDPAKKAVGLVVLPAYPRPTGPVIRPAPEKAFVMNGTYVGRSVRAVGSIKLAAMGAELPLDPFRFYGRLGDQGIEEGTFYASAAAWGIRGNGGFYTGVSWVGLDDLVDWKLRLQVVGTIGGRRKAAPAAGSRVTALEWASPDKLRATIELGSTEEGDHLVTICYWNKKSAVMYTQATVLVPRDAHGAVTLEIPGLKKSRLEDPNLERKVLLDGHTLELPQ